MSLKDTMFCCEMTLFFVASEGGICEKAASYRHEGPHTAPHLQEIMYSPRIRRYGRCVQQVYRVQG